MTEIDDEARVPPGALARMADALAWPMLLLHADGRLLHANAAAQRLLRDSCLLVAEAQGMVGPADGRHRAAFVRALADAAQGRRRVLHWQGQGDGTVVALTPLPDEPGEPLRRPVLVLLAGSGVVQVDAAPFAQAHGLSAAETRVLQCIAQGEGAVGTAARLGVGVATVRTQLAAIRRKAGVAGMAQLRGALAQVPPLLPPAPRGN